MMKDNGNGKNDGSNRSTEVQSKDNGIRKSMMVEFAMAKCHQSRNVTSSDRDTPSRAQNTTMPRKRSAHILEIEAQIDKAVEALKSGEAKSPYAAAKLYGLHLRTLTRHLNGGLSHSQSHEEAQLLSITEEDALALWCRRVSAGGYPVRHQLIREMAWEILTRH